MRAYWTDKKPDGTPITDGRVCRVVDAEDGTIPLRFYGRTQEEVFEKIERTMATSQSYVSTLKTQQNGNGKITAPTKLPVLSADETMQLTQDLQNPAKSADASYKLHQSEQNRRLNVQQEFTAVCEAWSAGHPEFFKHKTNQTLLINKAFLTVGSDMAKVTPEILDQCFADLQAGGYLLTENDVAPATAALPPNQPSAVPPDGSPDPVPARPTGSVTSTTGHRSTRLGAPAAPRWQPKYTRVQLEKMPLKDTERLIKTGDKDYREACSYWYGPEAQATA